MRKLRSLQCLCLLLCLLYGTAYESNAQMTCGNLDTLYDPPGNLQLRGPNADCGQQSDIFHEYFKYNYHFRPWPNKNAQTTTPKTIKVRAIVVNNTFYPNSNFHPNQADRDSIRFIFEQWPNTIDYDPPVYGSFAHLKPSPVPYPANCDTCYIEDTKFRIELLDDIIFINEHQDLSSMSLVTDHLITNYATAEKDSVLNLFIVNYERDGTAGANDWGGNGEVKYVASRFDFFTDSTNFIFAYNAKMTHWDAYTTFIHEIGHIFELTHLNYNCSPGIDDRLNDIFPPNICPYYAKRHCDPFAETPGVYHDSLCTGNLMSTGRFHLSPIQLGIMHRGAYLGPAARYTYPTEAPHVTPWEITSNQEWDFGIRMYQNIIVKTGNTLTIKCEVQMPPGSKIIVEKGAKLVLDGGTITSYHPNATWEGVEVYGDRNAALTAADQGSFEMVNDAMIEYANTGVKDCYSGTWHGGGIVKVNGSTFKDCWRAALFHDYTLSSRSTTAIFDDVTFINENADALTNADQKNAGYLAAFNQRGILIKNSSFENRINITDLEKSNYAIYGNDAGYIIENNSFKGYKVGVYPVTVFNTPNRSVHVVNSTFDSLNTGILFAENFSVANNNEFSNLIGYTFQPPGSMIPLYQLGEAIYADNAGGLTVTKNKIFAGPEKAYYLARAITVNNSKTIGARVVDNEIDDLFYGIITQKNNPATDLFCNKFSNGYYNIAVNPESSSSVLKNQGNGCDEFFQYRAGNTFDGGDFHIYSSLANSWNYYSWGLDPTQIPSNISGLFANTPCTNGSTIQDPNSQCNLPSAVAWSQSHFDAALSEWNGLDATEKQSTLGLNLFANLISWTADNGDAQAMVDLLENMNTQESKKLLLAVLLETKDYGRLEEVLNNELELSEGEQEAYSNYYSLLRTIIEEDRQLWQLEEQELDMVQNIAAGEFEVSPYANALLEYAYGQAWYHHQEQVGIPTMRGTADNRPDALQSKLYDAVPNPAGQSTKVAIMLIETDAANASLVVRNMLGQIVYQQKLQEGQQTLELQLSNFGSGIYTYSLNANGKVLKTKRLVISH